MAHSTANQAIAATSTSRARYSTPATRLLSCVGPGRKSGEGAGTVTTPACAGVAARERVVIQFMALSAPPGPMTRCDGFQQRQCAFGPGVGQHRARQRTVRSLEQQAGLELG